MEKKIGSNKSSGAKKVERIEEENAATVNEKSAPKKNAETKSAKKSAKKTTPNAKKVKAEKKAADSRVKAARARSDKKEKKLEKRAAVKAAKIEKRAALKKKRLEKRQAIAERKLARKEKLAEKKAARIEKRQQRRASLKEKKVERRAERIARRELLKNESKEERRKRVAREKKERRALARRKSEARDKARSEKRKAREAAHARKAADKQHRREQRTERKKNRRGIGGWIAAVVSLGVACLALSSVVTAGAVRMNDITAESENGYRSTLYEMVSACEELDDSLGKLRVASGANEQKALLTDVLVDAALMESALERIPVDQATSVNISAFVNRAGSYCRTLLSKLERGGTLSDTERSTVEYLYHVNDKLYGELNELVTTMSAKQLREFLNGKQGAVSDGFGEIGQDAAAEPEETVDAPFAGTGNVGENALGRLKEVSSAEAEEAAKRYFEGYRVRDIRYTGETLADGIACYNFVMTDENGVELFAEITKNGARLAFFDTYEECTQKNFDLETCDKLAREYLAKLGIRDVEAVWLSDGGMVANLTYTAVRRETRIYSESILVRVCEEKGRVIGIDARDYLVNDAGDNFTAGLAEGEARGKLASWLEPYGVHLALINVNGEETLAYEYGCMYGEEEYIVYLDANTGEEIRIFRVRASAGGDYLR